MALAKDSRDSSQEVAQSQTAGGEKSSGNREANASAGDVAVRRMANAPSNDGSPVAPGNEIWVRRPLGYHHAGVYIGNNQVVQVHGDPVQYAEGELRGNTDCPITKTSVAEFAKGDAMSAGPDKPAFPEAEVIARALARVGDTWHYNPVNHNCQTFASQIVTGNGYSPEGEAFQNAVPNLAKAGKREVEKGANAVEDGVKSGASKAGSEIKSAGHKIEGLL